MRKDISVSVGDITEFAILHLQCGERGWPDWDIQYWVHTTTCTLEVCVAGWALHKHRIW